jgi:hypothetical protein
MKLALASVLIGSAAAFAPPSASKMQTSLDARPGYSEALPFEKPPLSLTGDMVGDFGFDPFGFSSVDISRHFNNVFGTDLGISDLNWLRESELIHGRICQVAVVGMIWPGLFGTFKGAEWAGGLDAYSYTNPIEAITHVPVLATIQIIAFMSYLEVQRIKIILEDGSKHIPGDQRFGQGGYNPFKLNYTPEEYEEKRLQELKHCRLAMLGFYGAYAQANASGVSIAEQLGAALKAPEYYAKAGYFFPEGI